MPHPKSAKVALLALVSTTEPLLTGCGGSDGGATLAPVPPLPASSPPPLPGGRARARVFLSGHSLLDKPIPEHLAQIARSRGDDYAYEEQNLFGTTIGARTRGASPTGWEGYRIGRNREGEKMDVIAELRAPRRLPAAGERYDTLVITERHDILWTIQAESTVPLLRHFHDRLIEGNPQGETLFVHVWLSIDKDAPAGWVDYEKKALTAWECAAAKVNLALAQEGRPDRVHPLPAATALVELVERALAGQVRGLPRGSQREQLNAIFEDNVHPTNLGAYYVAAVLYAAVFRKSPEGAAAPPGIAAETAADLQRIAWRHISAYQARGAGAAPSMEHCRTVIARDVCPGFWRIVSHGEAAGKFAGGLRARFNASRKSRTCRAMFEDAGSDGHPFRWPDPKMEKLPPPPATQ
jgi:hypothetical protein